MASEPITLATRGSALALAQTQLVLTQCRSLFPDQQFRITIIKTTGDKLQTASLASANLPKGLFTKELELAVLNHEADIAIHSLKDLPTEVPSRLRLGAVTKRADPRDVLIYRRDELREPSSQSRERRFTHIADLPNGAVIATISTRRQAFLQEQRPDLKVVPIRGNVPTRLKRFAEHPELSALILAAAGLERLGFAIQPDGRLLGEGIPMHLAATPIDPDEMLPCVGQAAIGLEIRANDNGMRQVCERLNDQPTFWCVLAERALLRGLGGGCQIPIGAFAEIRASELRLRAASFLNKPARRGELSGPPENAEQIGQRLAAQLLAHQRS